MIKLKKTQNNEEKKQTKTQKKKRLMKGITQHTYSEQLENPFLNQVSNTKNTKNI